MGSMAQDAISFGLDPVIAPDGREWCDSSYGQTDASREIWGNLQDGCSSRHNNSYTEEYDDEDNSSKLEGHSKKVWERMGYRVKYGETYAYKHYGNEIYTANQVTHSSQKRPHRRKKSYGSSNYTKARSSETHTYDEWQELGYQVRKGEKACRSGGSYFFSREQVARVG